MAKENFAVEVRDVDVDELFNAKEVFVTSTTKRIFPVVKVDNVTIGTGKPGEVTSILYHHFLRREEEWVHANSIL